MSGIHWPHLEASRREPRRPGSGRAASLRRPAGRSIEDGRPGSWRPGLIAAVLGAAALCCCLLGAALAGPAPLVSSAAAAECPNEALRQGPSALLPECRAYEMVSPPDKANGDVETRLTQISRGVAGLDEEGYAFLSYNGLPGSENGALQSGNVAKRGGAGWTSAPFGAPTINHSSLAMAATSLLLSPDLNKALVASQAPLTPDSLPGENLYVRTISPPSLQLITPLAIPVSGNLFEAKPSEMIGASDDFSHIVFESKAKLTPDTPELGGSSSPKNLYEWNGSTLVSAGILPGETEPPSSGLAPAIAVSSDGQRILFRGPSAQMFLREHGTTIDPTRPAPGVVETAGGQAIYGGVSSDISSIFFRSTKNLTTDAFTGESSTGAKHLAPNLYRYDVETGDLADLTIDRDDERGADVSGKNVLVAADGEAAFFVAGGVMAPGATLGALNLYRWSAAGGIDFIVQLNASDPFVTVSVAAGSSAEASTDPAGDALAFVSVGAPTGESPVGIRQIYHWSKDGGLTCASCVPGTGSPAGYAEPAPQILGGGGANPLSADGSKVFFSTTDRLVPQDTNRKLDAYEWVDGVVHLISTGSGEYDAEFLDASPSTKDVFFVTRDRLVAADRDENTDVYDARAGGGFAEPPPAVPCEAEACRPPLGAAPPAAQIGSRSFSGPVSRTQKSGRNPHKTKHRKKKHQKRTHHKKKHNKKHAGKRHRGAHKKTRTCRSKTKRCPRGSHQGHTAGKRG